MISLPGVKRKKQCGVTKTAMKASYSIIMLDVSNFSFADQITAATLQGLVNREQPALFLDYGIYDDPNARRTNEDTMPEDIWRSKFRQYLGNQDRFNLDGYRQFYSIDTQESDNLNEVVRSFLPIIKGVVVWDPTIEDSINIAVMYASLEDLLPIPPDRIDWAAQLDLPVVHDLRNRWQDRVSLYQWALEHLQPRCSSEKLASIEPGWYRPEFLDYAVKEKMFVYSLSAKGSGKTFERGWNLLMLILGGPAWLRNLIYNASLFHRLKHMAQKWMSSDPEVSLGNAIQKKYAHKQDSTIFGWHTCRDDEFAFLQQLSANGLRLVPSFLSSNFSFHSGLPAVVPLKQEHVHETDVILEQDKVYLTFTYSDGDQLMLMNTAQIGGWRRPERGKVPFNWEMQPLLVTYAPALLGLYYSTVTPADCLIAGPSGAGYIIPPLHDNLPDYLEQSAEICRQADITVITSYYPDPPKKVIKQHFQAPDNILGFISGYFYNVAKPIVEDKGSIFICNEWPQLSQIFHSSDEVMAGVREIIEAPGPKPRFVGVHLFAYRTTVTDVYNFVQTLDANKVKVVRADEFVIAAKKYFGKSQSNNATPK